MVDFPDYTKLSAKELQHLKKSYQDSAKLYDTKQMAAKICINAVYGALGNKFFKYYSLPNASAVTATGQIAIKTAKKAVDQYLNKILNTTDTAYVSYADTDSLYIRLDTLVDKMFPGDQTDVNKITNFLDKFVNTKIEDVLHKAFTDFQQTFNHRENRISFKREAIADKTIFKSKKRYIMNVIDNEGVRYSPPELKIMGMEVVKSSSPRFCRDKLKQAIDIIINGNNKDLKVFIRQTKKEFKAAPLDTIASPRGVSDIAKYIDGTAKSVPIHVKGSIEFNKLIKLHKLSHIREIGNGTKVRYLYLREPNHIRSHVICFINDLPKEFDLHKYIDYDTMFNKSFIEPLKAITDIIGWDVNINGLTFN